MGEGTGALMELLWPGLTLSRREPRGRMWMRFLATAMGFNGPLTLGKAKGPPTVLPVACKKELAEAVAGFVVRTVPLCSFWGQDRAATVRARLKGVQNLCLCRRRLLEPATVAPGRTMPHCAGRTYDRFLTQQLQLETS